MQIGSKHSVTLPQVYAYVDEHGSRHCNHYNASGVSATEFEIGALSDGPHMPAFGAECCK